MTNHNGFTLNDLYSYDIKHNEINGEMKYYLKPFIEDFNTNIYVKVDSSYTKNKLEVKIKDKIFSTSNVDKYLSLLEKTTIRWLL